MNKTLYICTTIALLLSPACYAEFKIGQYQLGMSNKAAAKVGLADCIDAGTNTIRCVPTGLPDVGATIKFIFFDAATRKVKAMRVENVQFHPFPEVSSEAVWRDAAAGYEASFAKPLKLETCGSSAPQIERYTRNTVSTCFGKSDAYRELKIGYNRVEESGGGHGVHRKSGNTPNVGASVYMAYNPLIKHEFLKRSRQRQEEAHKQARPVELKKFEQGH